MHAELSTWATYGSQINNDVSLIEVLFDCHFNLRPIIFVFMTFMPTPQQHELDAVVIKRFTQDFPFDFHWKDNQTNNPLVNMGCVPLLTQVLTACENRRQQFPVKDFGAHFIGRFVQSSETFSNIHNAHGLNDEVGPVVETYRAALLDNWKGVSDYKTELLPLVIDLRDAIHLSLIHI